MWIAPVAAVRGRWYVCIMQWMKQGLLWRMLAGIALAWMVGCGGNNTSVQSPDDGVLAFPDTTGGKSLAAFEAHVLARAEGTDTALADHKTLLAVLTDTIPGYKLEFRESNRFKAPLFSFTEANKVFYNSKEDYIELTLGDYWENPDFFRVNLQRFNLASGVEISGVKDEKRKVAGFEPSNVKDFFSWSSHNSRKHLSWVFLGVNERYFLTIEATGQPDFLDLAMVKGWLNWSVLLGSNS